MWILIFFLREKRSGHIHQTFTYNETGHIKKKRKEKSVHWILLANCVLLPGPGSWRSMECVGINKITHRNLLTEKFKGLGAWYSGMIFLCRIVLGVSGKDQLEIQLLESKGITLSLIIFYLVYFCLGRMFFFAWKESTAWPNLGVFAVAGLISSSTS